ncbi:hypothetical protein GCK32_002236 [Trichostrongylus colubriformis]|uniref:Serpin domain-containing protein n=1 Tax=Trichostrongylus colubriformis TaxID=6319 RepID=A0AAN8FV41_TRICO
MTNLTPKGRRSTIRDVVADMAVGSNIWETWNRISYQVFEAIVRDDARHSQDDANFQPNNTWLCVPQLISNLACLTSVAAVGNGPGEALRRELMNEPPETGPTAMNMPRSLMNLVGDELRQWENSLHSLSKPGVFTLARRILVHPKFTKSYAYNTFVTLNSLGVEMKIFDGPGEIVQWIQKNLRLTTLLTCPYELWRCGEPHLKKENPKEATPRDVILAKSNQRCPLFIWASYFQITFKSGIFESESVFTMSGTPDVKGEEMYIRFHSEKPKMRYCSSGRTGILEVPTNATCVFLYFVTDVERSTTGPQLVEMIREVQKTTAETHTAYIPVWWPHESVSNVAKGIKNSLDAEPLFSHGGFGDFAMEDAEASAEFSKKFTSSIQHFDSVTVFHTPDTTSIQKVVLQVPSYNVAHIRCPYTVIIYDDKKKMPIYFGRIVRPKGVDTKVQSVGENEHKPRPSRWCRLM